MCTAATYVTKDHYFGRNLDLEYSYHEQVTVVPRHFVFQWRNGEATEDHFAMIGMAYVAGGYPLFYDGINEAGLGMAGLNFPTNCIFNEPAKDKANVASFELIPWILSTCRTIADVHEKIKDLNITNEPFAPQLPPNPLHWMVADKESQIVIEQTSTGLHVYDDPVGVMTNNPTFDMQLTKLVDYRNLTADQGKCAFASGLDLPPYSRGMGAMGLPGDLSSASRFAKVAFTRMNSVSGDDEASSVSQFFHILQSVCQQRGLCRLPAPDGGTAYEITIYSSCCNQDKGIYYYTTYDNSRINAVDMNRENLNGDRIKAYDLNVEADIRWQN